MVHMAEDAGLAENIFRSVEDRNEKQQLVLVEKIKAAFGDDLSGKTLALWGIAFKPETDDIRGAPAIAMAKALDAAGAAVVAFDPQAMDLAAEELADYQVTYVNDPYEATEGADALIVATEWRQFKQPDFRRLVSQLGAKTIFDGRNIYNPERCMDYGLTYVGIGRSSALYD